jgi:GAF domain-containing protein
MNFLETRFTAERFALKLRWLLTAGAAAVLMDHLLRPVVFVPLAFMLLSAAITTRLLADEVTFLRKYQKVVANLARLDALFFALTTFAPGIAGNTVWFFAIPYVVLDALVRKEFKAPLISSIITTAVILVGIYSQHQKIGPLMMPAAILSFSIVVGHILSNFQQRDETLRQRDHRLNAVLSCGGALADNADLQQMMLHALKTSVEETKAQCGYIMLVDKENPNILYPEVAYSSTGSFEFPEKLELGEGLSGYVAKMGQPISISAGNDEQFDGIVEGVRSAACVPLVSRGYKTVGTPQMDQNLGVLTLIDQSDPAAFSTDDMELLRTMSSLVAVAVSNARMEERRRATFPQTLESLATALEARDEYTRGHSQRVCELSLLIGERMGFSPDALEELRIGTILHDIGKIGVPDAILNKRARLTDEEFLIMKAHPVIGYEICKPLMLSEGVLMIIRNHHEKLDGSGYPDGLKGGELPLSLRIVCVADAFDAMSSRRPYRAVMEIGTVLGELSRGAGTQFDSVVVENLKELLHNGKLNELYSQYWDNEAEGKAA